MACCVVLNKLPDVLTDEYLRKQLNTSSSSSKSCGQKPRISSRVSLGSSDEHKLRSKREETSSTSKHGDVFKEPGRRQLPPRKCNQKPAKTVEAGTYEVIVLSDSDSDATTNKKSTKLDDKGKSEHKSRVLRQKLRCPPASKSATRRGRKRASSVEWDWSGNESSGPSNVPQSKSKKRTRKRKLSVDSDWDDGAESSDSDSSDTGSKSEASSKECHVCGKKFRRPFLLRNHLPTHSKSVSLPFLCDEEGCSKAYTHQHHLERHKSISHSDLVFSTKIQCPAEGCGKLFASGCGLKRHINQLHSGKSLQFPCSECNLKFRKLKQLRYHMSQHTGVPPLKCDVCGAGAYNDNEMKRHKRAHKQHKCDVPGCAQIFSNYTLLRKHIAEHNRCFHSLRCAHCSKEFTTKHNLRAHVMTHLENKSIFKCTSCPRFYYHEKNLKCHIRLKHERKSKFVCSWPDCDKMFYNKSALTKHIHVHENGIAPFKRKEGPRAKRKDAGKHKRAMASKLAGITLPHDVEKKLLDGDVDCSLLDCKFEKDELQATETSVEDLADSSEIVPEAKQQKKKLKQPIQQNSLSAVDELIIAEPVPESGGLKVVVNRDGKEQDHTKPVSREEIMDETINTDSADMTESSPDSETSLILEESNETIQAVTGKMFEVTDGGILVEVESCSETKDDSCSMSNSKVTMDQSIPLNKECEFFIQNSTKACEKDSLEIISDSNVTNIFPLNISELFVKTGSNRELTGADQDQRSGEKRTDFKQKNPDEQELRLNVPSSIAASSKDIHCGESNIKVYSDAPVANLMSDADVDGLCVTLCSETVVEGPVSNAGVEILIVIPSTAATEESYSTDSVLQNLDKTGEMFAIGENCLTNSSSKSVSVSVKTVCQEQIHKLTSDEPYVASVLQPFLQNLSKNDGCKEYINRSSVSIDDSVWSSSTTATSCKFVPTNAEFESAVIKLAGLIRNPFFCEPINIHKLKRCATFQEHLQGPTHDTAESDGSSDSDSDNISDYGSNDDESYENIDEDDLVEDNANEDNSQGEDGEDDEDDNDEDEHPEESDDDDDDDEAEDDQEDNNDSDDEEDGNNNGVNQSNGNPDNDDVSDNGNNNNRDSGSQENQDSAGNENLHNGSKMGIDRTQDPKLSVQNDCVVKRHSSGSESVDICGIDDDEEELVLPVSEELEDEDTIIIKTSGDIISGSDASTSAVNESTVVTDRLRSVELDSHNVAQTQSSSVVNKSKKFTRKPEEARNIPQKRNASKRKLDSKTNAPQKKQKRKLSRSKLTSTKKKPSKVVDKRDSESSNDSEPQPRKKQRTYNIGDDSDDSDWKPPPAAAAAVCLAGSSHIPGKLQNPANPESANGSAKNVETSFKTYLETLKNTLGKAGSKLSSGSESANGCEENLETSLKNYMDSLKNIHGKACSKLSEGTWINVLRQVTKKRNLSSIVEKD